MVALHPLRPIPDMGRFAIDARAVSEPAQPSPRQNLLLAALPCEDYERLLPHLEAVTLPQGLTVHAAGVVQRHLYFLTAGVVSRFYTMQSGASAEFAVTGREGVVGVASFLGGGSTLSQAVVVCAGHGYRLRVDRLQREFEHDGPLPRVLLRYTQSLIAQIGQIAVCKRHHPLDQRLCRWLLSCLDRLPANELTVTHDLLADMLGVRREGITETLGRLHRAGVLCGGRGHIVVADRPALEARACECYAVVRREYDRLLADCRNAAAPPRSRPVMSVRAFPALSESGA
jgi:CRP-like cAMP-binding protein